MDFDPALRSVLSAHDLGRFPSDTRFDKLGRACCEANCMPRKERYESWHSLHECDLHYVAVHAGDRVVSTHACGSLTDRVLARDRSARLLMAEPSDVREQAAVDA